MEDLNSPELKQWIDAENALAFGYLNELPQRGLRKDGANPAMLYGFGGFGLFEAPQFRPEVIASLERGGVYATANIRGGGEYGHTWHEAGMFEKKQNVFDDFIAAAEYLVREKYVSPQTLGIMGGSNGGLLVGAVMEQRPDLFAVALAGVAVLDMLRFHRFTGGVVGTTEYGSADHARSSPTCTSTRRCTPSRPARATRQRSSPQRIMTIVSSRAILSSSPRRSRRRRAATSRCSFESKTQASHAYRPTDKRIAELADGWAFALAHMIRPPDTAAR